MRRGRDGGRRTLRRMGGPLALGRAAARAGRFKGHGRVTARNRRERPTAAPSPERRKTRGNGVRFTGRAYTLRSCFSRRLSGNRIGEPIWQRRAPEAPQRPVEVGSRWAALSGGESRPATWAAEEAGRSPGHMWMLPSTGCRPWAAGWHVAWLGAGCPGAARRAPRRRHCRHRHHLRSTTTATVVVAELLLEVLVESSAALVGDGVEGRGSGGGLGHFVEEKLREPCEVERNFAGRET